MTRTSRWPWLVPVQTELFLYGGEDRRPDRPGRFIRRIDRWTPGGAGAKTSLDRPQIRENVEQSHRSGLVDHRPVRAARILRSWASERTSGRRTRKSRPPSDRPLERTGCFVLARTVGIQPRSSTITAMRIAPMGLAGAPSFLDVLTATSVW